MGENQIMHECPWGVKTSLIPKNSWKEDWECVTEFDDEAIFITKKTFLHEEDNLTFEYKYVIQFMYAYPSDTDEEPEFFVTLLLTPLLKCLPQSKREKIRKDSDLKEDEEIYWDCYLSTLQCPTLKNEKIDFKITETFSEDKNINSFLCRVIYSILSIDSFRGFYLDNAENRLGTTGWDYLKELLSEGYDAIAESLKRYKQN